MLASDCPNDDVKEQASGALWNLAATSNKEILTADQDTIIRLMRCLVQSSHSSTVSNDKTFYLLWYNDQTGPTTTPLS